MSNYLRDAVAPATQREQARPDQVVNNAGGYVFQVDDWARLHRFMILGSEGGTYYASERKLTKDNAAVVQRLIATDGVGLVRRVVELSESGRAPKNDPAILALAMAAKLGDAATRAAALGAVARVCRIGTHLYHFAAFVNQLGGWGRGTRSAIAGWFNGKPVNDLAYQLVKYQQRDGWSARDLLRLAHVKPATSAHNALYRWACGTETPAERRHVECAAEPPAIVGAFIELHHTEIDPKRAIALIGEHRMPHEAVPSQLLNRADVWEALLPHMGMTALIKSLAKMTKAGLIAPLAACLPDICRRLTDPAALAKARVHPIQLLSALRTYATGRSVRGESTWTPVRQVVDALDAGFYAAFQTVEPTGKPTLLALDVSGSMADGEVGGIPGLSPREASAAMALVTAAREPRYHIMGFSHRFVELKISPRMRLSDATRVISGLPFESTDCSLPMIWAQSNPGAGVESMAVYTDNETYHGRVHPFQALKSYRQSSGLPAKLAVVALTATQFTIADPNDAGMLDFVGFDAAAPALMADFFRA